MSVEAPISPATRAADALAQVRAAAVRAARALEYDGVFWRKLAYAGAARSPEWWRRYSPAAFGSLFYAVLPRMRATVVANQARMLGLPPGSLAAHRAARALFVQFAECLTDTLEQSGRPDRPFGREAINEHYFHEARAAGRGLIFVTAHTGSWEIGGRLLGLDKSVRVTLVMANEANAEARAYASAMRARAGVEVVYASGNDPSTALTLLTRLRENGVVAVQIDRPPPSATVVETRLRGLRWPVPEGPFRLAQATGAPVVPVFLHRSGYRRYTLTLSEPIRVERGRDRVAVTAAAQQATEALERFVRAHPDQWFHFAPLPTE